MSEALVAFIYLLVRDHLPAGELENILEEALPCRDADVVQYSNVWLGCYAKDVAVRLTSKRKVFN